MRCVITCHSSGGVYRHSGRSRVTRHQVAASNCPKTARKYPKAVNKQNRLETF